MAPLSMPAFDPIRRLQHVSLSIHNYLPFQFNFPRQSILSIGLPRWLSDKESACQCRRHQRCGFNPWVRKIPWRRKWQSTPVFLPGESHGQKSLVSPSPLGCKELDTTERLTFLTWKWSWLAHPGSGDLPWSNQPWSQSNINMASSERPVTEHICQIVP